MSRTHHKTAKPSYLTHKSPQLTLSSYPPLPLSAVCPRTLSGPSAALAEELQPQQCPGAREHGCLLHQGSIVTHRRCGLVMISRDYGWLMVGKYSRNHQLWEGEGISLTLADLH